MFRAVKYDFFLISAGLTNFNVTHFNVNKYKPTLVVEWTYKHGAKDELILSCTEHIGPNDELKLSSLCVLCAAICVRAQLSMNSS